MSVYYPSHWSYCDTPYDKKTDVINNLIYCLFRKDILSSNSNLRRLYLVRYSPYYRDYTLVFEIDGDYNSQDILISILLNTTDKILDWCDLTDRGGLDIELNTRGRRGIIRNYYEIMWDSYTSRGSYGHRDRVDETHPRFQDMCRWIYHNKPREYDSVMNKYDPYRYQSDYRREELVRQRELSIQRQIRGGEQFYQQSLLDQQRELMRGQMSLRWSDYETNNPCAEIELPNVVVTQRVTKSKLNEFFKKLKL